VVATYLQTGLASENYRCEESLWVGGGKKLSLGAAGFMPYGMVAAYLQASLEVLLPPLQAGLASENYR
jgi:hypothetical protein